MSTLLFILAPLGLGAVFLLCGWRFFRASDAGALAKTVAVIVLAIGFVFVAVSIVIGGCAISGSAKIGKHSDPRPIPHPLIAAHGLSVSLCPRCGGRVL